MVSILRDLLGRPIGLTLVQLMVFVVALGLAGGTAYRWTQEGEDGESNMPEALVSVLDTIRSYVETLTNLMTYIPDRTNYRSLMGSASMAKAENAQLTPLIGQRDTYYVIRWQRPCNGPVAIQSIVNSTGHYENTMTPQGVVPWSPGGYWNGHLSLKGNWDASKFVEQFPVGFAVEMIFAPKDGWVGESSGVRYSDDLRVYNRDGIKIYKFTGDVVEDWGGFPSNTRVSYPYQGLTHTSWRMLNF